MSISGRDTSERGVMSGELPLTYLPLDPFLIVYFLFPFSLLSIPTPSIFTGSISSDVGRRTFGFCRQVLNQVLGQPFPLQFYPGGCSGLWV
jgi:hypothetical protein